MAGESMISSRPEGGLVEELVGALDLELVRTSRWFQAKDARIIEASLRDFAWFGDGDPGGAIAAAVVEFELARAEGAAFRSIYYLPLLITRAAGAQALLDGSGSGLVKAAEAGGYAAYMCVDSPAYSKAVLRYIENGAVVQARKGRFEFRSTGRPQVTESVRLSDEYSNSVTLVHRDQVMKTRRRLAEGFSAEVEVCLALQEQGKFPWVPQVDGYGVYRDEHGREYSICIVERFIPNEGDGWSFTQRHLARYLEGREQISDYLPYARQLGATIAGLHDALARLSGDSFRPQEFTVDMAQALAEEMKESTRRVLGGKYAGLDEILRGLDHMRDLGPRLGSVIRCHGDLHLGQVLRVRDGWVVLDFEGEPIAEGDTRAAKSSPLRDIAGMLRSFDYAAHAAAFAHAGADIQGGAGMRGGGSNEGDGGRALGLALEWETAVERAFLDAYFAEEGRLGTGIISRDREAVRKGLAVFKLAKAVYELGYELGNRPTWVQIPRAGIERCLAEMGGTACQS